MPKRKNLILGAASLAVGALVVGGCSGSAQTSPSAQAKQGNLMKASGAVDSGGATFSRGENPGTPVPLTRTPAPITPDAVALQQVAPTRKADKSAFRQAPMLSSSTWINSPPLTVNGLRDHVVVVSFWTFACYNCQNTLPYFKAWDQKYRDRGLVIIGVHTPELSFERDLANVKQAVRDDDLQYPIAIDGDYANWNRYGVMAWPT